MGVRETNEAMRSQRRQPTTTRSEGEQRTPISQGMYLPNEAGRLDMPKTYTQPVTFLAGTSSIYSIVCDGVSTGGTLKGISFRDSGTEYGWMGKNLGFYGMTGTSDVFFGVNLNHFILVNSLAGSVGAVAGTNFSWDITFGGTEMILVANQLNFNNGATDTFLNWATSGVLGLGVGSTQELKVKAGEIEVTNDFNHSKASGNVGFYGATITPQYTGNVGSQGYTAGLGPNVFKFDDDTFDGGLAGTQYSIQDIVRALILIGILAP